MSRRRPSPNERFVGTAGSRRHLNTPALVLDLDRLESNLSRMAAITRHAGVALRPHSKGHKSVEIARRQVEAGAIGICCTTLGEAEVMTEGGIGDILITSPVVGATMIQRLIELNARAAGLLVVVDNAANVSALDSAAGRASQTLSVVVEFDVGQGRTGAIGEDAVLLVATAVAEARHLRFAGVQAYYGHLQHVPDLSERRASVAAQAERILALRGRLASAGLPPQIVTGGGTGTFASDCSGGAFTEIQPGSYLFLDREYTEIALTDDPHSPFLPSLFVQSTVVSANRPGFAVVNAGYKSFATEGGPPVVVTPPLKGAGYRLMGDEHGGVSFQEAADNRLMLAEAVEFLVPHCDPTINLFDWYHCVRGDTLVEIWPVDARGC